MCRFIETIRVEDGRVMLLPYHQERIDRTLHKVSGADTNLYLEPLLESLYENQLPLCGVSKLRILYDSKGKVLEHSLSPYSIRNILSLRLVKCDDIEYGLKYADRSRLSELATQAQGADEIIIVRGGKLTDTSYSNIALYDGHRWFTPRHPLLAGTMRQHLIDEGCLIEKDITPEDLDGFQKISLINAMMPLGVCCVELCNVM